MTHKFKNLSIFVTQFCRTHHKPRNWFTIPTAKFQCENYHCLARTIPLRVFKVTTINKLQRVSIGARKNWYTVVVTHTPKNIKTMSGMERVAFSRATSKEKFTIRYDDMNDVSV